MRVLIDDLSLPTDRRTDTQSDSVVAFTKVQTKHFFVEQYLFYFKFCNNRKKMTFF